MTVQLGWKVDSNACISCRACEMACKVEYDIKAGQGRRRRVIEKTLKETSSDQPGKDVIRTFFLSLACNQCEKPACIAACPIGDGTEADRNNSALWKQTSATVDGGGVTGVVRVNADLCIGCRRCEWACPYGAPQFNPETGKIHKCEMCWERIRNTALHLSRRCGACVATCLGQAIKQDWVDTSLTATYLNTPTDDEGIPTLSPAENLGNQTYPAATGAFASPGMGLGHSAGRGTNHVADARMTKPALKIRNRVYVLRDGSGVE